MALNKRNAHLRDALITFDAEPHKYTCQGEADYISVTTWNHSHFKPFDADVIIQQMMSNKRNWLKSPYFGKSKEEIKAEWELNGVEAARLGTEMHAAIERWASPPDPPTWVSNNADLLKYNRGFKSSAKQTITLPRADLTPDGGLGACLLAGGVPPHYVDFVNDYPNLKPYRTEWMIFDEEVRLAGSIDMVYEADSNGELLIYDWKRCKEIKKYNNFGDYALTECIKHLPDTNFWHYALQLNLYKAILEGKYGKKIKEMWLVGLHPNALSYQMLEVPDLSEEIAALFIYRKQQLKNNVEYNTNTNTNVSL